MTARVGAGKGTILVVEDNPITRKMVRVTLETEGYAVLEAPDGRTALELAAREKPVLVLQDLLLPDMDGFDLVARLRALPATQDAPILAFTGFLSRVEESRVSTTGFTDLLLKPVEPSRLIRAVNSYVVPQAKSEAKRKKPGARRLLVVDDDPIQLKLQKAVLSNLGYEVAVAANGVEGLEAARRDPPDAIVSDVLMPGMDGFRLTAAVRKDPKLARVPIVLASSHYVSDEDHRLAVSFGAQGFVVRTPGLEELAQALAGALVAEVSAKPLADAELMDRAYLDRVVSQLDRQATINLGLLQRASLQASALTVLGAIGDGLGRRFDVAPLQKVLAQCIDAAGLSRGAVYVRQPSGAWHCEAQLGYEGAAPGEIDTFFGHERLVDQIFQGDGPMVITPDAGGSGEDPGRFLVRAGASTALIAPLAARGDVMGALLLVSASRQLGGDDWKAFAQAVASQLGQAIALGRAFSQLAESERRYRDLFDGAPVGLYRTDAAGRLVDANLRLVTMLGYPDRESLLGISVRDMYADPADFERLNAIAARDGAVIGFNAGIRRRDGSTFWADTNGHPTQDESGRPQYFEGAIEDITERQRAEVALRASEMRYRSLVEGSIQAVVIHRQGTIVFANPAAAQLVGYQTPDELLGASTWSFVAPEGRERLDAYREARARGESVPTRYEFAGLRRGGEAMWVDCSDAEITWDGAPAILATMVDITQRKQLEEQYRQAQKMEAVGRLAGGVAHDFNNLLTAITGYTDLVREDLSPGDPHRADLDEVRHAADRAAGLTRQLLAFSRRQVVQPRVLDLNDVVAGMEKMLRRIIGEDVQLQTALAPSLAGVSADPGQIEQVIVNIAVNARDAMPSGGRLTIETGTVELDENYTAAHAEVRAGQYVMLAVSDTGTGMSAGTQARIFEPFFTTKEPGKGTGLGLATVYGIVKQGEGHVNVYSELGQGTTFKVYFPVVASRGEKIPGQHEAAVSGGTETVLLVEDEESVRKLALAVLQRQGYTVLDARDGAHAVEVCRGHPGRIHILLTDVVMPGVGGPEAAGQLKALRPDMKVLYMSGYTDRAIAQQRVLGPDVAFLQKPFTPATLARKVREVLDGQGG